MNSIGLKLFILPIGLLLCSFINVSVAGLSKTIDVAIADAQFIIYVDQPGAGGDRDTYEVISWLTMEVDVGHTWWEFRVLDKNIVPVDLQDFVNVPVGYYPSIGVSPFGSPSAQGILMMPDTNHSPDVTQNYYITFEELMKGLSYTKDLENSPGVYDLNTNNCTDAAIQAGRIAGQNIPGTQGVWPNGGGSNPGDLGEDLR